MLKSYLTNLSSSELRTLAIASPCILVLLCWVLIIKPVSGTHSSLKQQLQQQQNDLRWMQQASHRVIQPARNTSQTETDFNLRQQVNDEFSKHNIILSRLNSSGSDQLSMTAENAVFEYLIQAIARLENQGINLSLAHITPLAESGKVSSKLTFRNGTQP